jgi:hypothetical protein
VGAGTGVGAIGVIRFSTLLVDSSVVQELRRIVRITPADTTREAKFTQALRDFVMQIFIAS